MSAPAMTKAERVGSVRLYAVDDLRAWLAAHASAPVDDIGGR